ncbi:uncharacterized protein PG986_014259 [Apiospora aurea]|uniref:Uncharacterized protein n=1 Tax=Apiospora aurea TaxID=335848 RepID=A0ABR1PSH7_9PEZI
MKSLGGAAQPGLGGIEYKTLHEGSASSTTVGGAATAQFAVRKASVLGIALIALWALSPIGGQASLRILSTGNYTKTVTFEYFKPEGLVHHWANERYLVTQKPILDSLWVSQLTDGPAYNTDMWNGVRILMVEPLEADKSHVSDDGGWYDVPFSFQVPYASMLGASGISALNGSTHLSASSDLTYPFPIETWYWTLDCLECNDTLQSTTFAQMFTTSLRSTAFNPTHVSSYMADSNFIADAALKIEHRPASTLPRQTYSIRLAQLLNTYWGMLTEQRVMLPYLGTYVEIHDPAQYSFATGTLTQIDAVLNCHSAWLVTCVFASSILLVLCLATPLLRAWTTNPQLALNFSSLVRDNAYVSGSGSGTPFEASDRTQFIGHLKIKFGDVKSADPVGHIALASMDTDVVGRVRKGRK